MVARDINQVVEENYRLRHEVEELKYRLSQYEQPIQFVDLPPLLKEQAE